VDGGGAKVLTFSGFLHHSALPWPNNTVGLHVWKIERKPECHKHLRKNEMFRNAVWLEMSGVFEMQCG
jgi:hypothetical protein